MIFLIKLFNYKNLTRRRIVFFVLERDVCCYVLCDVDCECVVVGFDVFCDCVECCCCCCGVV